MSSAGRARRGEQGRLGMSMLELVGDRPGSTALGLYTGGGYGQSGLCLSLAAVRGLRAAGRPCCPGA